MTETTDRDRAQAVRDLEAQFGEMIAQLRRIVAEHAQRLADGLLPGEYKVFTTIVRRPEITHSALAETLLADKGQISRTVRKLEQLNLVERAPDPEDGRSRLLSPTAEGLSRLEAARDPQKDGLVAALDAWEVSDIRRLRDLLAALLAGTRP